MADGIGDLDSSHPNANEDVDKQHLLLSFRTLTMMVSIFERAGFGPRQNNNGKSTQSDSGGRQVRVLWVLATLLVCNNEIIAVTTVDTSRENVRLVAVDAQRTRENTGRTETRQRGNDSGPTPIDQEDSDSDDSVTGTKPRSALAYFAVANPRRFAPTGDNDGVKIPAKGIPDVSPSTLMSYLWTNRPSLPEGMVPRANKKGSIYFDWKSE